MEIVDNKLTDATVTTELASELKNLGNILETITRKIEEIEKVNPAAGGELVKKLSKIMESMQTPPTKIST